MTRVLKQNALYVASENPALAAEVDGELQERYAVANVRTIGDQFRVLDALCAEVLRRHGYEVA
jgi:hypothetical protein